MRLLKLMLFAMLGWGLVGCGTQTSSVGISPAPVATGASSFCLIARPLTFDRLLDTQATIAQIKQQNAVGVRLCGWGKAP